MTIVHKKSSVSGKRPKNSDLVPGELAINTADGSIFLERDDGEIIPVNGHCSVTASDAAPTDTTSYAHLASFECDSEYGDYNGIFVLSINSSTTRCSTIFSIYLRVNNRVNGILVDPTINIDIHSSTPNELPTGPDDIYITYNTPATTTDKCKFELWVKKTNTVAGKISLSKLSSSSNRPKTVFTETFNNTPLNDESVTSPKRLDGVPWLSSLSSPLPKLVQSKMKDLSDSISPLYRNNSTFDANDIEPGQRVLCLSNVLNVPPGGNNWYIESKKTYSTGSALQIAYKYSDSFDTNLKFAIRLQRDNGGWSAWEIFDNSRVDALEASVADMKSRGIANSTTSKGLFDLDNAPVGSFISVDGTKGNSVKYHWPVCENLSDSSSVWFNVITFGDSNTASRLTQYATQVFPTGTPNNQNRTWYRSKHGSTWSSWEEVAFANPTSQSVLDKTTLHEMYSNLTVPSYMDSGSLDDLLAGQFCNASSAVTEIPVSGRSWSVFCRETTRKGGLIQVAYSYPTNTYTTNSEEDFYSAYRVKREGYTTWSRWYVTSFNQQEERERVKVVDRATHEVLPCVYNPVNKTLVQAAPYDYSYSTTTLGINVVDATTTPHGTTNLYSATLKIPAVLVGELRDTIFQGTFIQKFTTAANNNIIVLPSTWVTTDKPINNPNEAYYTVTLNSESPLSNYTNIVGINYSNKTLILGEVTNVSSTAKTFTLDNNTSLSLIGIGAYVKTQDGTANIGVVTSNKGRKITVEEVSGGFAAYEAGANGAAKRTRLRISNPLTTYPDIQGSTLGTYTTPINTRILVKNQGYVTAQNGIYTLSSIGSITSKVPYVLTRASDFDRGSLIYGASVKVVNGVSGDTLFKNNLKSSFWTHYSTGVEYEENGVFARGTLQDLSGSIVLSNCFSVNNVTFKITGLGLDNNTNKYYVSYVVKETTTVYNRKSIDKNLTTESSLANPITLPSEIFYKVYDVTTNTVLSSLPVGATIDYVVYGYGV